MEVFSEVLPSQERVLRAVVAGGGVTTGVDREPGLLVVRYAVDEGARDEGAAPPRAFIAVRSLEGATLGCALKVRASPAEAELALSLCRAVSWSPDGAALGTARR